MWQIDRPHTHASELLARQRRSQHAFFAALASGSDAATLLRSAGVQATVVPVRPFYSIFNSIVYTDPRALVAAIGLLRAAYEERGARALSVWVPPGDDLSAPLERHDFIADSSPMLMGAAIADLDLTRQRDLDLDPHPTAALVAAVNDAAHGILPEWSMTAVFARELPGVRPLVAREQGVPAAALLCQELDGDCYFWFVATHPEHRGRGLASELMRQALRDARASGCRTATLESTSMAESLYRRLGFLALGRYRTWECRF